MHKSIILIFLALLAVVFLSEVAYAGYLNVTQTAFTPDIHDYYLERRGLSVPE
jgi:hypothetical protein